MVALLTTHDTLLSHMTTYDQPVMWKLRYKIESVYIGDMLTCRSFALRYVHLDNGYRHYRLSVCEQLLGIVEVRGQLYCLQQKLTAYLWWLGFRHDNTVLLKGAADHDVVRRKARDLPRLF